MISKENLEKAFAGTKNSSKEGSLSQNSRWFPSKESAVRDHLLFCDNYPSFEEFFVLAKASSKFSSEIMESLLIKRDTPNLNRNTASVELLLFEVDKYLLFYFITNNSLKYV